MATVKLTNANIKGMAYLGDGRTRDLRWDQSLANFGLRIYPTGRKAFVVSYRAEGRKRLMTLGSFGAMTLEEGRKRARKALVAISDGQDPLAERQRVAQGETIGNLIEAYIERHAKVHKKTWAKDLRRFEIYLPKTWSRRKVASITRAEVARLHIEISRRAPYEANRLIEILRKMFGLARVWGFLPETAPNPAQGIERNRELKRQRWARPEELKAIAKAVDLEPNVFVQAAIWLYLLTGLRRNELLGARWDQVDLDNATLYLPDTKSGEAQSVFLSEQALAILGSIPRLDGNPYVLPGAKPGAHLVNIAKAWDRIRQNAGAEDLRLHDLRRSVGAYLSQSNVDLNRIRGVLRHKSISTTIRYAQLGEETLREVMDDHGRHVLETAGRAGPVQVVADRAGEQAPSRPAKKEGGR